MCGSLFYEAFLARSLGSTGYEQEVWDVCWCWSFGLPEFIEGRLERGRRGLLCDMSWSRFSEAFPTRPPGPTGYAQKIRGACW